jgi:hypothetical protein
MIAKSNIASLIKMFLIEMTGKDFFEGFNPYNTSLVVQVQKDVASRRVL